VYLNAGSQTDNAQRNAILVFSNKHLQIMLHVSRSKSGAMRSAHCTCLRGLKQACCTNGYRPRNVHVSPRSMPRSECPGTTANCVPLLSNVQKRVQPQAVCSEFDLAVSLLHTLGAEVPKVWGAPPVGGAVGPLGGRKLFV
jgi:hypothetical protein